MSILRRVSSIVLSLALLGLPAQPMLASSSASTVSQPSVTSDLADYAPASLVTLTGAGWQAGEAIHFFVNDDKGEIWNYQTDVVADGDGGVTVQFTLPDTFVAIYNVVATGASGSRVSYSFTDAIPKISQTPIAVTGPVPVSPATSFTFGTAPLAITYTGGSGSGAVTYSVTSASTACTVTNPNVALLTILHGTGTCAVKVTKAADATYSAANDSRSVPTNKAAQNPIVVLGPTAGTFGDRALPITYSGGSGTGAVTYSVSDLSDACVIASDLLTLNILHGSGTCTVKVTRATDDDYLANSDALAVNLARVAQTPLTITGPSVGTFGATDLAITSVGGSGSGAVTYSVLGTLSACAINGADAAAIDITHGSGTCVIRMVKAADADHFAAADNLPVTVSKAAQDTLQLTDPTWGEFGSVGLPIRFTGGSGTGALSYGVTSNSTSCALNSSDATTLDIVHGVGVCTVTLGQAGDDDYLPASSTLDVDVAKIAQDPIVVTGPIGGTFGDTALPITYTGGSGSGEVTYSVTAGSDACAINANDPTTLDIIHGSGTCSVRVTKATDRDYRVDADALKVALSKLDQSALAITGPIEGTYGDTALPITYTGGTGTGAVSYSVNDSDACTINSDNPAAIDITLGEGTCTLTVIKAGDDDYNAASSDSVVESARILSAAPRARFSVMLSKAFSSLVLVGTIPTDATFGDTIDLSGWVASYVGSGNFTYTTGNSTGCELDSTIVAQLDITSGVGWCHVTVIQAAVSRTWKRSSADASINVHRANADDAKVFVDGSSTITTAHYGDSGIPLSATWGPTGSGVLQIEANPNVTNGCLVVGDESNPDSTPPSFPVGTLAITEGDYLADGTTAARCRVRVVERRNDFWHVNYDGVNVILLDRPITITPGTSDKPYDTTTASSGTPTLTGGTLADGDVLSGCTQSFDDPTVGTGKTLSVTPDSCVITHTDGTVETRNYAITLATRSDAIISKADQAALTVAGPSSGTYGDKPALSATGGSGTGALTFTAETTNGACSIGSGDDAGKLLITAGSVAGNSCHITAHNAGDDNYADVVSDPAVVTLNNRPITISPSSGARKAYDNNNTSSGTPILTGGTLADGDVLSGCVQTYDNANVGTGKTMSVTPATCVVTHTVGSIVETSNYTITLATRADGVIDKANQATLTVATPGTAAYGDKLVPTATGGTTAAVPTFTAAGAACAIPTTGVDTGKLIVSGGAGGVCKITAHKAGDAKNNAVDSAEAVVTITKRAAILGFTGSQFWATANASATTASVTFTGTLTPAAGGTVNLLNATVEFLIYSSANTSMTTADSSCIVTASTLGVASCTKTLGLDNWTVVMRVPDVNNYFTAPLSDPAVVTVYPPTTDRYTHGGGWLLEPVLPATPTVGGSPTNNRASFGFSMRYKSGSTTTPSGQLVYTFRGSDGYDYVVKSTSWTGGGLAFGTGAAVGTASFSGKATVTRIRPETEKSFYYYDRDHPTIRLSAAPSYTFRVDLADKVAGDTFAISISSALGVLYHRAGTTAAQIKISGGNIVVH